MKQNKKEQLVLFTNNFPFDSGEEFLETELLYLSNEFDHIILVPYFKKKDFVRNIPNNCEVVSIEHKQSFYKKALFILINIRIVIHWILGEIFLTKKVCIKNSLFDLKVLLHRIDLLNKIEKRIINKKNENFIFYSYWFNTWGSIIAMLNYKYKKNKSLIRIHLYDFDIKANDKKYFPFRNIEISKINHIAAISNNALEYMKNKYKIHDSIISVNRLGVLQNNILNIQKQDFVLVSVSSVISVKRVDLIIKILENIDLKIKWIHFGDGELMADVKDKARLLPSNIEYEFKGYVSNSELLEFYKKSFIDLFINVSELEGIPVTIMEAISFGIPVVGCNVGGIPEIVNKTTGILLKEDFDIKETARLITEYLLIPIDKKLVLRKNIKTFFNKEYNAEKNYPLFIQKLKEL